MSTVHTYALEPDLTFEETLPSVTVSAPDVRKPWNRTYKMRPKNRGRLLRLRRDPETNRLVLEDADRRAGERQISTTLESAFLAEAIGASQLWHNLDRDDAFANGAIVLAKFKGDRRATLQLHSIPGILSWRQSRMLRIGVIERRIARPIDQTHVISRLHGNRAPGK